MSAQKPSKKIKSIDSYFLHAPRLNQNVASQAAILEPLNKQTHVLSNTTTQIENAHKLRKKTFRFFDIYRRPFSFLLPF